MPSARPFRATAITVRPFSSNVPIRSTSGVRFIARSPRNVGLPTMTSLPSMSATTPLPGRASNAATSGGTAPRSKAAFTTAAASGCSDDDSAAAAIARSSRSLTPSASTSRTTGLPSVRVPVLSKTTRVTRR